MKSVSFRYLILFIFVVACTHSPQHKIKLTILHTNDHHGRFWPNKDGELGMAPRSTLIKKIRDEVKNDGGHVLLLDAGDVNTGVPQSDLQDAEPDFKGMSLLGYDVMAVGNHEFDKPLKTIFKQQQWGGFPFVSANIYDKQTNKRIFPSHVLKEFKNLKVIVFGLTTEDTPMKSNPKNSSHLKFVPAVEEAKTLVPTLRAQSDVLIALTHIGHYPDEKNGTDAPGDVTLARQVNGIDVIVGGHTQKPLFQPDIQNGAVIVQAAEWGKYLGRVDLEIVDHKVILKSAKLIPINLKDSSDKIQADPQVVAALKDFKEKGDASLQTIFGSLDKELVGKREIVRSQETSLGNLIALANKQKVNADLSIINSGGIRDSLYPGQVSYESILMVLPFASELTIAEMKGEELKKYLEYVIFNLTPGSGSFPQMSGVKIIADQLNKKIAEILINDKPIDGSKIYRMAIPEFIAGGGDKYPHLVTRRTGFIDAEILKDFIAAKKHLKEKDYSVRGYIKFK